MKKHAVFFLIVGLLLFFAGLLMIFDTTAAEVIDRSLDQGTHYALVKQFFYGAIGAIVSYGIWTIGYQRLLAHARLLFFFFTLLLVLVFIPPVGQQINGAHRWLNVFGFSFQPSELMKIVIPLFYIKEVAWRAKTLSFSQFLKKLIWIAIPLLLILIEPDNGSVAIILATLAILFVLTEVRWTFWALPLAIFLVAGGVVAAQMPHVSDRLRIYLDPELDLKGKGHQPYQAKIAAGSGKLLGRGVGESLQKLDYLPEARSDYIAAIFAEEFGFLGVLGLIFLYLTFGYLGFYLSAQTLDREGFYLVAIFTFLICFQAFLNLGIVSGLLPSKGTNLPFFSQGGSSLISNCIIMALILNVSHAVRKEKYCKNLI